MGCGQAQKTAGEEDRSAEEGREEDMDRGTGDETGRRMLKSKKAGASIDRELAS